MTSQKNTCYTVTAALPYANGPKHIGHLAGAYLPADAYARYLRGCGRDVIFVCGSDEHGTAIPNRAFKEQATPQAIVDKYHVLTRDSLHQLGISFDVYHRTSDPLHHETAREFFTVLHEKGVLQKQTSDHFYDEEAGVFLADRYLVGTCPHCHFEHAYGDQCEQCGTTLAPEELINPLSTLTGKTPTSKSTVHWYLPLEAHADWLRSWILDQHGKDWKSNVIGQCKSWLDAGLRARAVTRDLDWGVKVPLPTAQGKVLYVWFEAPIGYLSATRALFRELASGAREYATPQRDFGQVNEEQWEKYWQKDANVVHFIGKDNIVFHCLIFPVMLRAAGNYTVPDNVPANEFMNLEGKKMSTSRGWFVTMDEYLVLFPDQPDALRYTLFSILPETKDSEFTWKTHQRRNNHELVAIFSNFIHRSITLTHTFFDGKVPALGTPSREDQKVIEKLRQAPQHIAKAIEAYHFREAMMAMMDVARLGNKYLTDTEPWKVVKEDSIRTASIIHVALQLVANLAILAEPFLPFGAARLRTMLNNDLVDWSHAGSMDLLQEGQQLEKPSFLYTPVDDEDIDRAIQHLNNKKMEYQKASSPSPIEPTITFDDFSKIDFRIVTIVEAERVKKSKKLLKLVVDIGEGRRTIMSGIAGSYRPEELLSRQVVALLNLAPRNIMGVESQGMLLAVNNREGKVQLVCPDEVVDSGSRVA